MSNRGDILQDHSHAEWTDDLDRRMEIFVTGNGDAIRLITSRVGHEPEPHLDDDSETRLCENAVIVRPEPIVEQLPAFVRFLLVGRRIGVGFGIRESSHASANEISIRQDNFQARMHHPVVSIRGIADSALDRVADDRPTSEIWYV